MFDTILDEIKILIVMELSCKTIRSLSLCSVKLSNFVKDNDLFKKRKFLGFPRTEGHRLAYSFPDIIKQDDISDEMFNPFGTSSKYTHPQLVDPPLIQNHCAAYDVDYLSTLDDSFRKYLYDEFLKLKAASGTGLEYEHLDAYFVNLLVILNEILHKLPISLIRGDIIYQYIVGYSGCEIVRFIFDGDKINAIKRETISDEFTVITNNVPIGYWDHICHDEKRGVYIEGSSYFNLIWLDLDIIRLQCLSNIKHNRKFKNLAGTITRSSCTKFTYNQQTYRIAFKINKDEFIKLLTSEQKLLVNHRKNNLMNLSSKYS